MVIKFICPDCGDKRLECCLDGPHICPITEIDEGGDFEYGEYESTADVDRFQCLNCGHVLKDGEFPITDNQEVAEWCRKNCQQE